MVIRRSKRIRNSNITTDNESALERHAHKHTSKLGQFQNELKDIEKMIQDRKELINQN